MKGFLRQRQVNQSQVTTATTKTTWTAAVATTAAYRNPEKVKRISNEDKIAAAAAKCGKKLYIAANGSNAMRKNVNSNGNWNGYISNIL